MRPDINELAKEIHAYNVAAGWWDGDPCLTTKIHLINTEICEATEGLRKGLMDDHLPHRKMEEVELADALIRTLDIGGRLGLSVSCYAVPPLIRCGAKGHLDLVVAVCNFANSVEVSLSTGGFDESRRWYTRLVKAIVYYSERARYDIFAAVKEKREYNKQRADHKPENRAKEGGKKF